MPQFENSDEPEVLAIAPLPLASERRRREVMLARVMLVAIDLVLSGEGCGWRLHATWSGKFGIATRNL
jgi:hypothetical protein